MSGLLPDNDVTWAYWVAEKFVGSVFLCTVVFALRACWSAARESQRAALGDYSSDHERKGLLMPLSGRGAVVRR